MENDIQSVLERGNWVSRCHTVPCLHPQTVAHHQCSAAQLAILICAELGVGSCAVVRHLLSHDIAEGYTGDIPANVKVEHEYLSSILSKVEVGWELSYLPEALTVRLSDKEQDIAKICDWVDLLTYCTRERALGNNHKDMYDMHKNIYLYIRKKEASFIEILKSKTYKDLMEGNKP